MNASAAGIARTFHRDGFAVVPNLFRRDEVKRFKEAIQRVLAEVRRESEGRQDDSGRSVDETGVYVGLAGRSRLLRRAVRDDRLVDILEAVIGPNVEFLSDKVVYKSADNHIASPWHQDWPYWQGTHKISVWVALDDAAPENGCLRFLPGSHRSRVVHDGDASEGAGFGHRVRLETIDEDEAVTVPLPAGGAAFFHDLTMHASHPNSARRERWTWVPTYRDAIHDDPPYPFAVAKLVVRGAGRE